MDPMDHPAYGGHDDDHNPGRASGETQVADVVPIPGEQSMGPGPDARAGAYATGQKKDPKIVPIRRPG